MIQQFFWGSWVTGKERIFLEVGKVLQKYIYVGAVKRRLLDCMDLSEEDKKWLTIRDQESHIHVVPLWSIASFKRMSSISHHYHVLIYALDPFLVYVLCPLDFVEKYMLHIYVLKHCHIEL